MKITNVQGEYLKVIYLLNKRENRVRVTDIAKELNKTKATVNYAINSLKDNGFVSYEAYGNIILTQEGEKQAKKILEAYDIVYLFLNQILKISSDKSESEAIKMKTTLDDETLNKLAVYVNRILGLDALDCGYDINKERCVNCLRRKEGRIINE